MLYRLVQLLFRQKWELLQSTCSYWCENSKFTSDLKWNGQLSLYVKYHGEPALHMQHLPCNNTHATLHIQLFLQINPLQKSVSRSFLTCFQLLQEDLKIKRISIDILLPFTYLRIYGCGLKVFTLRKWLDLLSI